MIYVIRHGESTSDIEERYGGDYDDHLSNRGKKQAQALAITLSEVGIQRIFSSPRHRAYETAQYTASQLNIPIQIIDGWRERNNYGVITGMTRSEAHAKFPEQVAKINNHKILHNVQDSEPYDTFCTRIFAEFDTLPSKNVAIFTHGGPIMAILREKYGKGFLKVADCGYVVFDSNKEIVNMHGVRPHPTLQ